MPEDTADYSPEDWKARKDQLHRQQASAQELIDEAEKVNLLSISKQKSEKAD